MKFKTAIYYSAMFLQLEEVCNALEGETADEETEREIELLRKCGNLIVSEIASDWVKLMRREKVTVKNGELRFTSLQKQAIDIHSLFDKWGKSVSFEHMYDKIYAPDGEYIVEYSVFPDELALDDDLPFVLAKPSERAIAYGIASEYCVISGLTADATIWESRFIDAMKSASIKQKEKRVKRRGWR